MKIDVLTIFPEIWPDYLKASILGRAQDENLVDISVHNIRDYTEDKHRTVDDTPYGGGAGMVLKIEPIDRALSALKAQNIDAHKAQTKQGDKKQNTQIATRTVVLSARGEQFTQRKAEEYSKLDQLILICGRYEGIDQRVVDRLADEEISIGPYVLNGGEVAAMAVIEAVTRLVPGVLGNVESLREESHSVEKQNSQSTKPKQSTNLKKQKESRTLIEYPQYTRPEEYKGWKVPEVLLSGDHGEIRKWRNKKGRCS